MKIFLKKMKSLSSDGDKLPSQLHIQYVPEPAGGHKGKLPEHSIAMDIDSSWIAAITVIALIMTLVLSD